jgi:pimeloyl-ACP methyl ester carboxylesterase
MHKIQLKSLFVVLAIAILAQSCYKSNSTLGTSSHLISYEAIDTLTLTELEDIRTNKLSDFLGSAKIKSDQYENRFSAPQNPVVLYRVIYRSSIPEKSNRQTVATGLIAIPLVAQKQLPLISYQHGTVFDKRSVPSIPSESYETMFMLLQYAAQGYVLISADYFGLGDINTDQNGYFIPGSTEQACLDLYKASLDILDKENITKTKFFINGWSQGGYNTMVYLRRLERENIKVNAAFTAAGPADPLMAVTRGIFNPRPFDAPWVTGVISNMIFSIEHYNNYPGLSKKYINPTYYNKAAQFYRFEIADNVFFTPATMQIDSLFTDALVEDAKTTSGLFWQTLNTSEAYKWNCKTPLRAYYGGYDEVISVDAAKVGVEYMKTLGKTNASLHFAGDSADHRNTYIESLVDAKTWIDAF